MWKQSRKILIALDVLHTAVPRWIALPVSEELLDMAKFLWQATDSLPPISKRAGCRQCGPSCEQFFTCPLMDFLVVEAVSKNAEQE